MDTLANVTEVLIAGTPNLLFLDHNMNGED